MNERKKKKLANHRGRIAFGIHRLAGQESDTAEPLGTPERVSMRSLQPPGLLEKKRGPTRRNQAH